MTHTAPARKSVATRIVALFVACALLPVALVILLSYGRVHDALVAQRIGLLRDTAAGYSTAVIDRLSVAETIARTVTGDARPMDRALAEYFRAIVVFDSGAPRVLFGSPTRLPRAQEFDALAPRLAAGQPGLIVQEGGTGPAGAWLVTVADPLAPQARRIAFELQPNYLWGAHDDVPYPTELCVFGPARAVLNCTSPLQPEMLQAVVGQPGAEPREHLVWGAGDKTYVGNLREVFLRGKYGAEPWAVVASQPEKHALAPVRAIEVLVVPVMALGLLLATLLGLVQVRRTLVPLKQLTEATARIALRDFDTRVPEARDDEFGALAHALNSMSARLGRQFKALSAQSEIDTVILSSVDLASVAAITLRRVSELVPADGRLLLLAEPGAPGEFRVHAAGSARAFDGRVVAIAAPEARMLLASSNGHCPDVGTAARFPWLPGFRARSAVALPIAVDAELAGVLVLGYENGQLPEGDEPKLLRELCDRIAVALATAQRDVELHRRAHFDALTQLPNRTLGLEQLGQAVAAAARHERTLAVLFVDLDGFSAVNDSLGHAMGDELLIQTAARLRRVLRKSDIVMRLGGDEFAIVLPETPGAEDAATAARHVVEALSAVFDLPRGTAFVSASVGVALYPSDGAGGEELLRHADLAMYKAKSAGRGRVAFFEASMNADVQQRIELDRELRQAIEQEQFELHYQPQLDLRSGRIVGAEALIRWNHPQRGLVPPVQFIGFAESSGLIERIGRWALHAACRQSEAWRAEGLPLEYVSVNVSPRQFHNPEFSLFVAEALQDTGMTPARLHLEITESAVLDDHGAAAANLAALVALGTPLELDDFGTGYSSLAHLQRLPVAAVKLDRAFIRPIGESESARAVVRAAIDMSHALGKTIVAEGVETAAQLALLADMDCDTMQGYHLSAPVAPAKFAQLMRAHAAARPAARLAQAA